MYVPSIKGPPSTVQLPLTTGCSNHILCPHRAVICGFDDISVSSLWLFHWMQTLTDNIKGKEISSGTFNLFFSDSLYQFYHHENIKKSRQILFREGVKKTREKAAFLKFRFFISLFNCIQAIISSSGMFIVPSPLPLPGNNINPWRGNVKTEECVSPFRIQNWQRLVKEKSILSKSLLNWHCVLNICQLFLWKQKYALRRRKPASREKIGRRGCGPRCWLYNCRTLSNGELQRGRAGNNNSNSNRKEPEDGL